MASSDQDLASLIASMPEEERIVLTLFYLKSESIEAIAGRLSVPERAVESVLAQGRLRLLSSLGLSDSGDSHSEPTQPSISPDNPFRG